jgi:hypothetical protein
MRIDGGRVPKAVMAGRRPGLPRLASLLGAKEDVDARAKRGHDE